MRFAFLDHPLPIAFAHRGGGLEAEENTMAAFGRAVGLGYSHVETDIRATSDGVPVVFHDATLERMTGDSRPVAALDWATLSRLRTRGGNPIPRLEELLEAWPGLFVNLEAKADAAVAPMIRAISQAQALERVCVGSFRGSRVAALRAGLGPGLCWSPAHWGVARIWAAGWGLPAGHGGAPCLQVPERFRGIPVVTPRFVRAAHRAGAQVHVWTVDDPARMAALLEMGVDGLMTDRPRALRDLLRARDLWPPSRGGGRDAGPGPGGG
ncbi:MAG: glycerophosphodiester phosphodiesterase [Rhodobacteraceae bacterium]|nr:glycerophosphodiester phosphodiesterase [Paracoccaceae bacterium]